MLAILTHRRKVRRARPRRAAVLVEFAVAAPIFLLFTLVGIELLSLYTLSQCLEDASYEGARLGIVPGATSASVITGTNDLLAASRTRGYTVSVEPATLTNASSTVTVTVDVNTRENMFGVFATLGITELSRSTTLVREGYLGQPTAPAPAPVAKKSKRGRSK
jgi:Flp pilus assembly protein TadG